MSDPKWLPIARRYIGVSEIPGKATTPVIAGWLSKLRAWWSDDETPWCGVFVAAVLQEAGIDRPRNWYRARAYLDWGLSLAEPGRGCVVVFARGGAGHVGFVVGVDERGRLMVLGGNQANAVNVQPFDRVRVLGYRWPNSPEGIDYDLPLIRSGGRVASREEA
jgi:uncharacterized protein (TIGR02594 family)